jgi:hypothetical protein
MVTACRPRTRRVRLKGDAFVGPPEMPEMKQQRPFPLLQRQSLRATGLSALLGVLACAAVPALAAPDVGVSVRIGQPGAYGRIDIGNAPPPPPALVYSQPILVQPPPRPPRAVVVAPRPEPVYMWVPPGHQRHWDRHCAQYGACGVPVYFVQDRWYREHRMAGRGAPMRGDGQPGYDGRPGYGGERDHDRGWNRGDEDRRDGGRGHGYGRGG